MGGTVFLVFLFDSMQALAVPQLGLSTPYIGYIISAFGVGGVVGSLAIAQWASGVRPFVLIALGQLGSGLLVALIGLGATASLRLPGAVWLLVTALMGVAASGVLVGFPTVVQTVTPDHLMGRTWTAMGAVPTALQVLAPAVGAAVVSGIGVGYVFLIAGCGLSAFSLFVVTRQRSIPMAGAASAGERGDEEAAVAVAPREHDSADERG
jgi:MFS family permease